MILCGGVVGSLLLLLLLFAVIHTKYFTLHAVRTGTLYDIIFWIRAMAILGVAIYGISALV